MIRQICTIDMPYINDDIPYMYEDKPYMYEDKPYMHDDKPHMYDDMTYIKDDMTDINDDMTDMYEYHIHVWYQVAWGDMETRAQNNGNTSSKAYSYSFSLYRS